MKSFLRRSVSASLAVIMSAGTIGVVVVTSNVLSATSSAAATAPPWEPDASSVGGLVFYDASGNIITGGNVTDSPIAAYVAGTTVIRGGDTKATLSGFLPVKNVSPGSWSGEGISASTTYPNNSAPAAVKALAVGTPVVTGQSGDLTISNLKTDFPNNDNTAGYAGAYQLRLRTTTSGKAVTTTYDSADIVVTGSTWSVVYSQGAQISTTTSLSTTPTSSSPFSTSVTLTATVTPSSAVGLVNFLDGSTVIGHGAVSNGVATLATSSLPGGPQPLKAEFVPTDAGAFTTSSSAVENFNVTALATSTKLVVTPASGANYGSSVTLTATVSPSNAAGAVAFYDGTKQLTTEVAFSGQAVYSTKALPGGTQNLKAVFTPASAVDYGASTSAVKAYAVKAVTTKVALKSSAKLVRKGAALTLTATLTPAQAAGSVWFYDGAKKIATVKVAKGRAVLVTKSLGVKSHVIKAVFKPTSAVAFKSATSTALKVTVTK